MIFVFTVNSLAVRQLVQRGFDEAAGSVDLTTVHCFEAW
jgi:hypothetical protein